MPFLWEKGKTAKISRLVSNHIHKRRDGSSLVVETGFPTSLVDLFIKNRQKLKKKKHRTPPLSDCDDVPPFSCPPPSPSSSDGVNVILVEDDEIDGGFDANKISLVVLNMFSVLCFALVTKRVTIGFTISACLLLFLDYLDQRFCLLSRRFKEIETSKIKSKMKKFGIRKERHEETDGRPSISSDEVSDLCEFNDEIKDWRNLFIVFLLILVGLLQGRAFALLLTLSCCLLLKLLT